MGGRSNGTSSPATPQTGDTPTSTATATPTPGATTETIAAAAAPPGSETPEEQPPAAGEISDLESDDDMESVQGEAFDQRDGETDQQRKKRIKQHLIERQQRRAEAKEAKRRERLAGKKGGAGGPIGNSAVSRTPANAGEKE